MLRIAAIDDEKDFLNLIHMITAVSFEEIKEPYELSKYTEPEPLLRDLDEGKQIDLFLLDVEMDGTDGLRTAVQIREKYPSPWIVYITNFVHYAPAAFETNAFRYILKSQVKEKLPQVYRYVLFRLRRRPERSYIFETPSVLEQIAYQDILYIIRERKHLVLVLRGGRRLEEKKTVQEILQELNDSRFIRISKKEIINIENVLRLDGRFCKMRDGENIPVSSYWQDELKNEIFHYIKRKKENMVK